MIAFENRQVKVKPDPSNWIASEDECLTRKVKVNDLNGHIYVSLYSSMWGSASLMRDDDVYYDSHSG